MVQIYEFYRYLLQISQIYTLTNILYFICLGFWNAITLLFRLTLIKLIVLKQSDCDILCILILFKET